VRAPKIRRNKKTAAIIAGGALALATAGGAYAYWTTNGSGDGSGATTAGVANQLSFTQDALTAMYPGDSAQPLKVVVANTSTTESAYVSSVKAFVTTNQAGCTGADFRLNDAAAPSTAATATSLTWTPKDLAVDGSANATGTIQFNNTTSNQDACKSATVTVHYLAS